MPTCQLDPSGNYCLLTTSLEFRVNSGHLNSAFGVYIYSIQYTVHQRFLHLQLCSLNPQSSKKLMQRRFGEPCVLQLGSLSLRAPNLSQKNQERINPYYRELTSYDGYTGGSARSLGSGVLWNIEAKKQGGRCCPWRISSWQMQGFGTSQSTLASFLCQQPVRPTWT